MALHSTSKRCVKVQMSHVACVWWGQVCVLVEYHGQVCVLVEYHTVNPKLPHAASGWRIHCGVEVTELSTNKQHTLFPKP